jgi:dTDP-4-amino-4,6-dideoxygalactose transaminase
VVCKADVRLRGALDGGSIINIPLFRPGISAAAQKRALDVLESGWLGYGPQCRALEQRFLGGQRGWALATNSCTSALYLAALLARGEGEAPEVVAPAITFISSAMAFAHAGFRVRVADVDRSSLTLTAEHAARCLTARTRAIVVVHLYGQRAPDLPGLRALADQHGVTLIEDCAHRVDLADAGPRVGDLACFSFNAVKELPGAEAGMLCARDPELEDRARAISNAGLELDTLQRAAALQHRDYVYSGETGLKLRSNDVAAALVLGALDEWPAAHTVRQHQFERYDALLAPLAPDIEPMRRQSDDSFLMYVIRTRVRESLRQGLAARNIATSVHYPSLARHPLFAHDADPRARDDAIDATITTLPTALQMPAHVQAEIAAAITDVLGLGHQARESRELAESGFRGDRPT